MHYFWLDFNAYGEKKISFQFLPQIILSDLVMLLDKKASDLDAHEEDHR